ncbi:MAG: hypothetical protein NZM25_00125 [Leptospiraceae bacterium]|nr:hypothetical protein [Leptospiraceae bacterium]MDW8307553.1 hypothetical protein [Leptospiraceae bacterium]
MRQSLVLLLAASLIATVFAGVFQLEIEEDPLAVSYEIQWLQNPEDPAELMREDYEVLPGRQVVFPQAKAPYFRLRARNAMGQPGPWSLIYTSDEFTQKEFVATSGEGNLVQELESEENFKPEMAFLFADGETYLKEGRIYFPPDHRGEIWLQINGQEKFRYEQEIYLEHNRIYEILLEYRNSMGRVLNQEKYRFKTDLVPPQTRRLIFSPAFGGKTLMLTPHSRIIFVPFDANSGVENTFCRFSEEEEFIPCHKLDSVPQKYQKACRRCLVFQYYSIDKAGNKEKIKQEYLGFIY